MPKKVEQYNNERKQLLDKLFNILEINENNNMFSLYKLDNDIDKQNKILELESEIKKYFICGNWTCFTKNNVKRTWLSYIKYTMKDMGYQLISSKTNIKNDDGTYKNVPLYHIIKINI
jgi:hypothetical protein